MISHTLLAFSLARGVLSQAPAPFGYTAGWWGNLPAPQVACHLDADDSATWQASGAASLVETWLRIHGEQNWLVDLQKNITSEMTNPNFLDCTKLGANTCGGPEKDCFSYNPPAHYFIRIAAAKANDFFDQANTALLSMAIDNILDMDTLISDFGPQVQAAKDKDYRIASASMSVAEKVLKNVPVIGSIGGDFIGLMSATTALIGLTTGPSVIDLAKIKEDIQAQLHTIFTESEKNIDLMNQKILNGKGPMDLNMVMDILKSMRGGAFLVPSEPATADGGIRDGMGSVKQSIIGAILRGTGYFVFTSETKAETCIETYGFQHIDGRCYGLWLQEKGGLYHAENHIYDTMQKYGINTVSFYKNVVECANGEVGEENVGNGNGYQKCFFNLKTWGDVKRSPCDSEGWKKFPELRLSDDICGYGLPIDKRPPPDKEKEPPCRNKCIRGLGWFSGAEHES